MTFDEQAAGEWIMPIAIGAGVLIVAYVLTRKPAASPTPTVTGDVGTDYTGLITQLAQQINDNTKALGDLITTNDQTLQDTQVATLSGLGDLNQGISNISNTQVTGFNSIAEQIAALHSLVDAYHTTALLGSGTGQNQNSSDPSKQVKCTVIQVPIAGASGATIPLTRCS